MFTWILEKIRIAVTYTRGEDPLSRAHVGLKVLSVVPLMIATIYCRRLFPSLTLLAYPILLTIIFKRLKLLYESLLAVITPITILTVLTWILAPEGPLCWLAIERSLALTFRVMSLALTFLIIFSTTNPTALAMFLENLGIPVTVTQSIILMWRLIPLVLRDLVDSILSLRLRGFPRWKTLVPVTAVSLERAYKLSQTLYIKGFAWSSRRTYIGGYGSTRLGLVTLLLSVIISVLSIIIQVHE